jgi:hypothetical protein
VDFSPKTNVVVFLDMGHKLREEHIWKEKEKAGNPELESV